mgnify:CR=1 FL=1
MSRFDDIVAKKASLSFVGLKVIECFKDAGLDQNYIDEKIIEFGELKNYEALHKALRILDDQNMARLAQKLNVELSELNSTLKVLNRI